MNRLQDMYGDDFHPIMKMAKNAYEYQANIERLDEDTRMPLLPEANKLWEGIAQYVEPKLKAVEATVEQSGAITITWQK